MRRPRPAAVPACWHCEGARVLVLIAELYAFDRKYPRPGFVAALDQASAELGRTARVCYCPGCGCLIDEARSSFAHSH